MSCSLEFIGFIMARGLQNGYGEICSTSFTLKFLDVSDITSCDILRKFRNDDVLVRILDKLH